MAEDITVKAIVLDLGGVMFENGTKETIKYFQSQHELDKQLLNEIFYGSHSWDLRKGMLSYRAFWDIIYSQFPRFYEAAGQSAEKYWHNSYTINPKIIDFISQLKKSYIIGVVSGNIRERIYYLEEKYQFSQFLDFAVYSFDHSADKLSEYLYIQAVSELNNLGVKAQECLFIDDNQDCLETASKLGFKTYHFTDFANFAFDKNLNSHELPNAQ